MTDEFFFQGISNWFAENYMAKLVNNSNGVQFQLDSCCEGEKYKKRKNKNLFFN